jgi:acetate kinase
MGIQIDKDKNPGRAEGIRDVGVASSKVKVLVIPTNEELEIANQCFSLLNTG